MQCLMPTLKKTKENKKKKTHFKHAGTANFRGRGEGKMQKVKLHQSLLGLSGQEEENTIYTIGWKINKHNNETLWRFLVCFVSVMH